MKIDDFQKYKQSGKKIKFITCYDYSLAKIVDNTDIDCILVGDSLAMTVYGHSDTINVNVDTMALHTNAVAKAVTNKFIVADLPFMSYRGSLDLLVKNVLKLMQAGANAVKLEGADGNEEYIKHLVNSGVPVIGHLGMTPQFVNILGGFKVQAKTKESAQILLDQAKRLENSGCSAIVLECVPSDVAEMVTNELAIPTIGIGAGNKTDGQVLVIQDMLGMNVDFTPKFVKKYMHAYTEIKQAVDKYCKEVDSSIFPSIEYSFGHKKTAKKDIKVCRTVTEIRDYLSQKDKNLSVGFVPTMGNLHDGHASLIKESVKHNHLTVLSIFVNPTQFNNKDDLKNYPKTLDQDLELAHKLGADCVFLPTEENIYHESLDFRMVCNSEFATKCEGTREGHFNGVLTVVLKLLNIVKPTNAYFGKKDYQQYRLIHEMVKAFFLDVNIVACETVRLKTGLALSSRNNRLSDKGIELASKVSTIIQSEKDALNAKLKSSQIKGAEPIYIEDLDGRRLYAFNVEGIRLIDNYAL